MAFTTGSTTEESIDEMATTCRKKLSNKCCIDRITNFLYYLVRLTIAKII